MRQVTALRFASQIVGGEVVYTAFTTFDNGTESAYRGDQALEALELVVGGEVVRITKLRASRGVGDTDHPRAEPVPAVATAKDGTPVHPVKPGSVNAAGQQVDASGKLLAYDSTGAPIH
jgi:hypothetical protein